MDKIPFAPYDFFGYIASGFALLAGMQLAFGFPPVLGRQQTLVDSLFLLLVVYIVGHVLATPSKAILENLVVHRLLRPPSTNLLCERRPMIRAFFFPGYYKPLPPGTRAVIRERARTEGVHEHGEELFLHIRYSSEIRGDEKILARLDGFRNQYGFNRNLCFTTVVVGVCLLVRAAMVHKFEMRTYGIAALAVGVFLFYRYLKFFRQYSYEMFNCYRPKQQGRIV